MSIFIEQILPMIKWRKWLITILFVVVYITFVIVIVKYYQSKIKPEDLITNNKIDFPDPFEETKTIRDQILLLNENFQNDVKEVNDIWANLRGILKDINLNQRSPDFLVLEERFSEIETNLRDLKQFNEGLNDALYTENHIGLISIARLQDKTESTSLRLENLNTDLTEKLKNINTDLIERNRQFQESIVSSRSTYRNLSETRISGLETLIFLLFGALFIPIAAASIKFLLSKSTDKTVKSK